MDNCLFYVSKELEYVLWQNFFIIYADDLDDHEMDRFETHIIEKCKEL